MKNLKDQDKEFYFIGDFFFKDKLNKCVGLVGGDIEK